MAALLPTFASPLEDPILRIPPIGRHYGAHSDFELAALPPSALQRSARPPAHAPLLKDRVSELKAQAAAEARLRSARLPCCLCEMPAAARHSPVLGTTNVSKFTPHSLESLPEMTHCMYNLPFCSPAQQQLHTGLLNLP